MDLPEFPRRRSVCWSRMGKVSHDERFGRRGNIFGGSRAVMGGIITGDAECASFNRVVGVLVLVPPAAFLYAVIIISRMFDLFFIDERQNIGQGKVTGEEISLGAAGLQER
jgi:hypothetical protein